MGNIATNSNKITPEVREELIKESFKALSNGDLPECMNGHEKLKFFEARVRNIYTENIANEGDIKLHEKFFGIRRKYNKVLAKNIGNYVKLSADELNLLQIHGCPYYLASLFIGTENNPYKWDIDLKGVTIEGTSQYQMFGDIHQSIMGDMRNLTTGGMLDVTTGYMVNVKTGDMKNVKTGYMESVKTGNMKNVKTGYIINVKTGNISNSTIDGKITNNRIKMTIEDFIKQNTFGLASGITIEKNSDGDITPESLETAKNQLLKAGNKFTDTHPQEFVESS